MLCASLKLLAKNESVIRKEAKKIVSGNSKEKKSTIFSGLSIGPIEDEILPNIDPIDTMAIAMLVTDKLAANNPEQTMSNNLPIIIFTKGVDEVSSVSKVPRSFSQLPNRLLGISHP